MKITARLLRSKGACPDQVALFQSLWPKGVEVTEALCVSVAAKFDWDWAVENLLPASAWAEYNKVKAPAWAEYNKVTASALAEYNKVMASALAEYNKVMASALAEYNKVMASAWAEYEKVTASAFGLSTKRSQLPLSGAWRSTRE